MFPTYFSFFAIENSITITKHLQTLYLCLTLLFFPFCLNINNGIDIVAAFASCSMPFVLDARPYALSTIISNFIYYMHLFRYWSLSTFYFILPSLVYFFIFNAKANARSIEFLFISNDEDPWDSSGSTDNWKIKQTRREKIWNQKK